MNYKGTLTHDTIINIIYNFGIISQLQGDSNKYEDGLFFWHSNVVMSTDLITDIDANITQSVLYLPGGQPVSIYNRHWELDTIIPLYYFQSAQYDEENKSYLMGLRYYSFEDLIFRSRDLKFETYFWLSTYCGLGNNGLRWVDPTGMDMELGDYYGTNGQWLGSDGINDNKAYTATSKNSDGTFNNAKELSISNSELLDRATWVHGESGGSGETITNRTENAGTGSQDARVVDYYANAINNTEPSLVLFEYKEETDKYWEICLNKECSVIGLVAKDTNLYHLKSWYQHFMGSMINLKPENLIRKKPIDNADIIDFDDDAVYIITEIKGDWIKVECLDEILFCSEDKREGWTKWVDNDKVIIELSYFP